jgi:hypothetical protein
MSVGVFRSILGRFFALVFSTLFCGMRFVLNAVHV